MYCVMMSVPQPSSGAVNVKQYSPPPRCQAVISASGIREGVPAATKYNFAQPMLEYIMSSCSLALFYQRRLTDFVIDLSSYSDLADWAACPSSRRYCLYTRNFATSESFSSSIDFCAVFCADVLLICRVSLVILTYVKADNVAADVIRVELRHSGSVCSTF